MDTNPRDPAPAEPSPPEPEEAEPTRPRPTLRGARSATGTLLATLVATAVIGIPAGYIWALLAPRALAQVVSRGAADVVNAETTAFIVADAWFVLIAAIGGLLTGVAGYLLVVRGRGVPATVGLILGGVGAAALMLWIGDNYGHAQFQHRLQTSPTGTYLHASLSLGAKGALAFWPLFAALAIAIPEAVAFFRDPGRSRTRSTEQPAATTAENTIPSQDTPAEQ
ncbi:MAG TPA: hypothetical protein VN847_25120 [Streptosporangiaceae bacterium]|nr:hypothetical protein [Streptosporangiaceae bacterium]